MSKLPELAFLYCGKKFFLVSYCLPYSTSSESRSLQDIPKSLQKHLLSVAWILHWISAISVHVLHRIMTNPLEDHNGIISIGSRNLTDLGFADDAAGVMGLEQEWTQLVECQDKTSNGFGDKHRENISYNKLPKGNQWS